MPAKYPERLYCNCVFVPAAIIAPLAMLPETTAALPIIPEVIIPEVNCVNTVPDER